MLRKSTLPLAALLFCMSVASAEAEESLLGLPTPDDPRQPGAVVLHGGGRVTDDVFDRFVELAGGKKASIVFVPSAGFRRGDYDSEEELEGVLNRRYGSWANLQASGRVRKFTFLYTDDPDDADNPDFVKPLQEATGVWFSGGAEGSTETGRS